MSTVGLYIHLPFCARKCRYCDFNSYADRDELIPAYVDALAGELEKHAQEAGPAPVDTVFFGGGTPTRVGAGFLERLLGCIQRLFAVQPGAEITAEANPGTVGWRDLGQLRKAGFNRLSLGAQASQAGLLETLGRIHSWEDACDALRLARRAGFSNVSLDLMFGLPGQTLEMWRDTLYAALRLEPDHISAYGLQLEEGTPLAADVGAGKLCLPSDEETADMYWQGHETLTAAGYVHYEISNFARPGRECRHNLRYWRYQDYLGAGAGAHSFFGGRRWANTADPLEYLHPGNQRRKTAAVEETVSPGQSMFEYLMLGLRTAEGISESDFRNRFGRDPVGLLHGVDEMVAAGFAIRGRGRLALTPAGWAVSNEVLSRMLPPCDPSY